MALCDLYRGDLPKASMEEAEFGNWLQMQRATCAIPHHDGRKPA